MTSHEAKMPPLPPCEGTNIDGHNCYSADQMRAMYLAGLAAAKGAVSGLSEKWKKELSRPMHDANDPEEGSALCQLEICTDELDATLTALEQEAQK